MKLLENKIVIITGASRGIGKSIAEECVQQGATVIFTYLSSKEKAEALEKELGANGGKAKGKGANFQKGFGGEKGFGKGGKKGGSPKGHIL